MRIYLIRHSMTKGNKEKRYIGTTDESLCLEGIQLLEERKGMYPEVTYVLCKSDEAVRADGRDHLSGDDESRSI